MTTDRTPEYLISLINELRKLPKETEWVEFKLNDAEPEDIGEYLSALANSAALCGKAFAYLVWGIEDGSHNIVGTKISSSAAKIGNEELESWLLKLLSPKIHFRFFEYYQLPAPAFEVVDDNTKAVLFAHKPLAKMDKTDRIRACYLHACLKYVNREYLTNSSVRERFGINSKNMASASRLIKEAIDAKAIVPYDISAAPKLMKYVPWWAAPPKAVIT